MRARAPRSLPPQPLVGPAVYGLDAGRAHARHNRRVRHVWDRVLTIIVTVAAVGGLAAGAWVGYQVYLEHTKKAEIEHQRGVEEQARRHADESLVDVIDDLGQTPVFNGPGAPALGLGPGTTEP
jgi:uncharacterized membrane protein YsdA (DUF1294 family)